VSVKLWGAVLGAAVNLFLLMQLATNGRLLNELLKRVKVIEDVLEREGLTKTATKAIPDASPTTPIE